MAQKNKKLAIYQARDGAIQLRADADKDTIWATQKQMAEVFDVDVRTINEHIKNIYKTNELRENSTIRKFRIVQREGSRNVEREVGHYNLDMIISVGYRVNSKMATKFRQWATKTLRAYVTDGFVVDKKRIKKHHEKFLAAVEEVRALLPAGQQVSAADALELSRLFADTWLSLDAYDRDVLPVKGVSKKKARITGEELSEAIAQLKKDLLSKKEATEIFAQERMCGAVEGIVGNVFQSVFGTDVYVTVEEKAAHLLYFMVKNHPFVDGNKRSGAFAFVWFLAKSGVGFRETITPQALTTLTLLVAESAPKDKDRMVGLIILLLKKS